MSEVMTKREAVGQAIWKAKESRLERQERGTQWKDVKPWSRAFALEWADAAIEAGDKWEGKA